MSRRRVLPRMSLRGWMLLSYLLVLTLPLVALVATGALDRDLREQTRQTLHAQAQVWALAVQHVIERDEAALPEVATELAPRLAAARDATLAGVQFVDTTGVVMASTGAQIGHSLADDPEVRKALKGTVASLTRPRSRVEPGGEVEWTGPSRFSSVRIFVAVPIVAHDAVVGAVVASRTPREEFQTLLQMAPRLGWGLLIVAVLTIALATSGGHWGSRSLHRLARAALQIARGSRDSPQLAALRTSHVREVAALASAVDTMRAQLQARLDYIDEFAGNVAHEFRTPIATLRGTFELMHDDPDMPTAQRDRFMTNALAELERLDALVGGLLALARAEQPGTPEPVDLDALLRRVCHGRERVDLSGHGGVVSGSSQQLEAVASNLVDNALQHGGPDAHVEVRAWVRPGETGFEVIDDGTGIPPGHLDRVFDRFFTTDRKRGIGLGLAMVRLVCRAHGGEVTVRSRPGHTVLSVALPTRADETKLGVP